MNTHIFPSVICLLLEHPHIKETCKDSDPRVGRRSSAPCYFSGFIHGGGTRINSQWWQEAGNDLSSISCFLPIKGGSLWPVQLWSSAPQGRFWDWWLLPSCGTSSQFHSTHFITGTGRVEQKQEGRQIQGFTLSSPPPGDLPYPGIEPTSLTSLVLAGGFFTTSATWEVEEGMATHSSIFAWKSRGQRSLVGYSPWGRTELDTTEQLSMHARTLGSPQPRWGRSIQPTNSTCEHKLSSNKSQYLLNP